MPPGTNTFEPLWTPAFENARRRKHIVAELRPEALLLGIEIVEYTNYIHLWVQAEYDDGNMYNSCWQNETYSTDLEYVHKLVRGLWREYHNHQREKA